MKTKIKSVILSSFAAAAAVAVFSFSVNDNSLESLSANAGGTKCVEATNVDCKSPSTGTIYNGYKLQKISGNVQEELEASISE